MARKTAKGSRYLHYFVLFVIAIFCEVFLMTQPASRKGYDFSALSYTVIGACQDVQRQLGVHCMEVDYQRALGIALSKRGVSWQREVEIPRLPGEPTKEKVSLPQLEQWTGQCGSAPGDGDCQRLVDLPAGGVRRSSMKDKIQDRAGGASSGERRSIYNR